jgi:double-stranded uracil-DNA glycosylase
MQHVLEDVLVPGLHVVFVGTAVGTTSAIRRAYYAGPGNKFWPTLAAVGLTPYQLKPTEFRDLPKWGVGLTDIAKLTSGPDANLVTTDFDVPGFMLRIRAVQPQIVAFNGKSAAKTFMGMARTSIDYGPRPLVDGFPEIHVLPSTSGAASGYWSLAPWQELASRIRATRTRLPAASI